MRMPPGDIVILPSKLKWESLLLNTKHPANIKLAGLILSKTASYTKKSKMWFTNASPYEVSRILNETQAKSKEYLKTLEDFGWLWDTGIRREQRKLYNLSFPLIPKERYK